MESYSAEDGEVEIEIDDAATSAAGTAFDKEVANYKRQTLQEVIDKSEGGKDVSGRMIIDTLKDFGWVDGKLGYIYIAQMLREDLIGALGFLIGLFRSFFS